MKFEMGSFSLDLSTGLLVVLIIAAFLVWRAIQKTRQKKKEEGEVQKDKEHQATLSEIEEEDSKKVVPTVRISGPILTSSKVSLPDSGFVTFADKFVVQLNRLKEAKSVPAVIIEFETPGGALVGSELLYQAIRELAEVKPVYAHVGDLSASGGVYSMIGATKVYTHKGSLVGSIGVVSGTLLQYTDVTAISGFFGKGVEAKSITGEVLFAGKGKALGSPFVERDEEAISLFKQSLERAYDDFLKHVNHARGVSIDVMKDIGAQIMVASQAIELGLVDGTRTRKELEEEIATSLDLKVEECDFVAVRKKKGSKFSFRFRQNSLLSNLLGFDIAAYLREYQALRIQKELSSMPVLMMFPEWNKY